MHRRDQRRQHAYFGPHRRLAVKGIQHISSGRLPVRPSSSVHVRVRILRSLVLSQILVYTSPRWGSFRGISAKLWKFHFLPAVPYFNCFSISHPSRASIVVVANDTGSQDQQHVGNLSFFGSRNLGVFQSCLLGIVEAFRTAHRALLMYFSFFNAKVVRLSSPQTHHSLATRSRIGNASHLVNIMINQVYPV